MLLGKWDRRRNQHVAPDDGRSDADDGMSRGGGFYVTQIILLFSLHARIVSVCWVCETGSSLALHRVDRRIYLGMLNVHCLWCHGVILVYFRFFFSCELTYVIYLHTLPAYILGRHVGFRTTYSTMVTRCGSLSPSAGWFAGLAIGLDFQVAIMTRALAWTRAHPQPFRDR